MAGFFGFFDYNKPGKGISKDEPAKTGPALYFDIFLRRFWKLIQLNLIHIICSIPAIVIIWFLSSFSMVWLASLNLNVMDFSSSEINALYILSACLTVIITGVFGTGAASAGMAYVLRNYVNDTHAWVWSDFKDSLKANFRQGTCVFLIDMVVIMLFIVSFVFYGNMMGGFFSLVLRSFVVMMFLIFSMMHLYIYPLMAGFELKIKDIYRNAFLLSMAKLPWNVFAFALSALLGYTMIYAAISSVIGFIIVICTIFSFYTYTQMFMVNNVIKKYILEPSIEINGKEEPEYVESVFDDNINVKDKAD